MAARHENITRLYLESISKGLNAIHVPSDPVIVGAVERAIQLSSVKSFVLATVEARNLREELGLCRQIEADAIILHGSCTDSAGKDVARILETIKERFKDVPTGVATHSPGTVIPQILQVKEVDLILAPLNLRGDFMDPDAHTTLRAIAESRRMGKKLLAMKSLAAGSLTPDEAFRYLVDKADGVAVGITSVEELDSVLDAGLRYFSARGC